MPGGKGWWQVLALPGSLPGGGPDLRNGPWARVPGGKKQEKARMGDLDDQLRGLVSMLCGLP